MKIKRKSFLLRINLITPKNHIAANDPRSSVSKVGAVNGLVRAKT